MHLRARCREQARASGIAERVNEACGAVYVGSFHQQLAGARITSVRRGFAQAIEEVN